MSQTGDDESEKSHEPTPEKLRKAREKGEVPRSADLGVAAAYSGLALSGVTLGQEAINRFGSGLMGLLDRPGELAPLIFDGPPQSALALVLKGSMNSAAPFFVIPAVAVLLAYLAQRSVVFAPSRLEPKLSRISLVANAKNKFGRAGLFEFAKSFVKLVIYSVSLFVFLSLRMDAMIAALHSEHSMAIALMGRMILEFMLIASIVAAMIGGIDALWQAAEHRRKNMMSRKELTDEAKEAEGDPYMKQARRQRGQEIASNRMMAEVPAADVVIVNPTHYAVVLKWSRDPGSAPVCVAKGVDEIAAAIRRVAQEAAVPIHHDPPTARALYATVELGEEIPESEYRAVAAAIRFAEDIRRRAKEKA